MRPPQRPGEPDVPTLPITVYGHPNLDTVLLWHPPVAEDDTRVADLAGRIATRGHRVVLPQWRSGLDLLRSLHYARKTAVHPPDRLTVVGYDTAGVAALALALHQGGLGIGLAEVVCVGGTDAPDPVSGEPLPTRPPAPSQEAPEATTVTFVAARDAGWTRRTAEAWTAAGWPVELTEHDRFA